ncbi:MAG: FadR family transcriptional regulator [Firmicutes bacterium]|nr:FadR family transcriptional regulator [Bacillota bacterium]
MGYRFRKVEGEALNIINKQPIYELVAREIKDYIIRNNLGPGDRLPTEKELCEQFGVSRTSIREAVKSLQSLGIIETKQKEGIVLRNLDADALVDYLTFGLQFSEPTVLDLFEARCLVETGIMPLVADRATAEDIDDMAGAIETMENAGDDWEVHVRADAEFHRVLIRASKNKALSAFADVIAKFFEMTRSGASSTDRPRVVREHREILQAIREKDPCKAAEILRRHLQWYQAASGAGYMENGHPEKEIENNGLANGKAEQ